MGLALDAGADDLKRSGSTFDITCDPASFNQVKEALEGKGVTFANAEITQLPKMHVEADVEAGVKVMRIMDGLDDHDDVQNVYTNLSLTEEVLAEASKE